MALLDRIPWGILAVLCLGLGLAPYFDEPHLWEKTKMLFAGDLTERIDQLDLAWHVWPFLLVGLKLTRSFTRPPDPLEPTQTA